MIVMKTNLTQDEAIAITKLKLYGFSTLRDLTSKPKVMQALYTKKVLSRKTTGTDLTPLGEKIAAKLISSNYMPEETRFYTRTIS
jgi:hypothetical protein